jgi:hypothetical protein
VYRAARRVRKAQEAHRQNRSPVDHTDQPEEEEDEGNVTKEYLSEKLKELIIKTDRAAIMKVFEPFGVSSLSALPEDQYVKMDIALTKALNRARG